jgi:hypothetical protein
MNAIKKHARTADHGLRTSSPMGKNQVSNDLESFDFTCRAQLDLVDIHALELEGRSGAVATLDLGASGHCADDIWICSRVGMRASQWALGIRISFGPLQATLPRTG